MSSCIHNPKKVCFECVVWGNPSFAEEIGTQFSFLTKALSREYGISETTVTSYLFHKSFKPTQAEDEALPKIWSDMADFIGMMRQVLSLRTEFSLNRAQLQWIYKQVKDLFYMILAPSRSKAEIINFLSNKVSISDPIIGDLLLTGLRSLNPRTIVSDPEFRFIHITRAISSIKHAFGIALTDNYEKILKADFSGKTPSQLVEYLRQLEAERSKLIGSDFGNPMNAEDAGIPVIKFKDGMAWYRIQERYSVPTAEALGHCGNKHHNTPNDEVWNLGKKMKDGRVRPALTFILNFPDPKNPYGGIIGEMKGQANNPPAPQFHSYIYELFASDYVGYILGGGHNPTANFDWSRDTLNTDENLNTQFRALMKANPWLKDARAYQARFGNQFAEHLKNEAADDYMFYRNASLHDHDYGYVSTYYSEDITRFFKDYKPYGEKGINPVVDYIEFLNETPAKLQEDELSDLQGLYNFPQFKWLYLLDALTDLRQSNAPAYYHFKHVIVQDLRNSYHSNKFKELDLDLIKTAIKRIESHDWKHLDDLQIKEKFADDRDVLTYLSDPVVNMLLVVHDKSWTTSTLKALKHSVFMYCVTLFAELSGSVSYDLEEDPFHAGMITIDTSETAQCQSTGFSLGDVNNYAKDPERFTPEYDDCYPPIDLSEYDPFVYSGLKFMEEQKYVLDPKVVYYRILNELPKLPTE